MTVIYRTIAMLMVFACFTACNSAKRAARSGHRLLDTITVSARNNPLDIYRATPAKIWEIVHTRVKLRFDFVKKEAYGAATLRIQPYAQADDTLVLDAKGMIIAKVGVKEGPLEKLRLLPYRYDSSQLRILVKGLDFGNLAMANQQLIYIEYTSRPYATEAGGSKAITEDRGLYFINTDGAIPNKPAQIWTQGETESNSRWLPTIDKPNQRTTLDLSLVVPDTMQTLGNGKLLYNTPQDFGMRQDDWQMDQPIQVYAIMFAIGKFAITKDSWQDPLGKKRDVFYYTEPAYASYARGMFRHTPEMIEFFSRATGVTYPWNKYSQVVVRDYVSGAMENTSASLFGEWMNQNNRQLLDATGDVVSHELFHQWFGDYVTAESWSNLTVNESFATYGEQLWRRYKFGPASAAELAFDDLQIYLKSTERDDPPLVRYHYRDREEMFDRVSYQKGASILHYINSMIGDTLFNKAMGIYLRRNALNSAEASQWRLALEEATGTDWTQFFNEWYYRGGHPVLRVRYAYDDVASRLTVTVRQASSPDSALKYSLALKAAVISGTGQRMEDWKISARSQTFTYPYEGGQRPVIVPDARHALPGIIKEDKSPREWLVQLKTSNHFTSKRRAITAAMAAQADPVSLSILQLGLDDTLTGIRAYTLSQLALVTSQSSREALRAKVAYLLQTDGSNRVRASALSVAGAWKLKTELPAIVSAIDDSSYYVAGSALHALRLLDADSAYALAERLLPTEPKGYLQDAVWTAIVTKGNPADLTAFEAKAAYVYGTEKTGLAGNLRRYAIAVKDDALYDRTMKLLMLLIRNENIRIYRYAIGSELFALQEKYKDEAGRRGKDAAIAKERLKVTEGYTALIMAEEKDETNLKLYRELGK